MKKILLVALLVGSAVHAQSVVQSGSVTAGHAARWITNGIIGDAGTAANGSLTSLGVTNNGGPGICLNSAAVTGPYNQFCIAVTTNGGTKLSSYAYGGATTPGITFDINGSVQGFLTATLPVTSNDVACFDGTAGNIKDCGGGTFSGFANPTAQVGNTAVNGVATTAMRSDAAPALAAGAASANIGTLTGDLAGSTLPATTIAAGAVTSTKMASGAAASNVGTLGGDLSGTLPNPTVAKIGGVSVTGTGASTNDVWYFNGTGWLHNALISLLNTVCTASPSTCGGFFGYFNVVWYGADRTGTTDSTTAINNAIAGAYTYVNNVPTYGLPNSGTCVFFPPGIYLVSSINLTEQSNGCLKANPSTVILYGNQQSVSGKPIVDMTGCSACTLFGINIFGENPNGTQPSTMPTTGILMADDSTGGHSDKNLVQFVGVQGYFTNPAIYIFGSTDDQFLFSTSATSHCGSRALFVSSVNDYSISSPYATINAGTPATGEVVFNQQEVHDCGTAETAAPLAIHSAYSLRFYGGVNDSSSVSFDAAHFAVSGSNQSVRFDGVEWESEHAQAATNLIYLNGSIDGFGLTNNDFNHNGYSGNIIANGGSGSLSNFIIDGNSPTITTLQPSVSSCGTSPSVYTTNSWHKFGTIREGTSATGCTITFNTAFSWSTAPNCVISSSNPLSSLTEVTSTTALTLTHGSTSNVLIYYRCDGP